MIDSGSRGTYAPASHAGGSAAAVRALIEEARQRQRRRRLRVLLVIGVLLLLAAAVGEGASGLSGGTAAPKARTARPSSPWPLRAMPAATVIWTSDWKVEVVSSRTGRVVRTLAAGVAEIRGLPVLAVSPQGVVYFDTARGTREWVMRVPITGGHAAAVAEGRDPAISPNGRLLAYVTDTDATGAPARIVVKDLATGTQRRWAFRSIEPDITSLSWSPDNQTLSFTTGGDMLRPATAQVLDTRAGGTLGQAPRIPLGPGILWAGFLTHRAGLAVIARPGRTGPGRPAILAEVAVSSGRVLRPLTALPQGLFTSNSYDGTENTITADPTGRYVLIAGTGAGTGAIFRWAFGTGKPVLVVGGAIRAAWA